MIIVKVTSQTTQEPDFETLKEKFRETALMYQDTKGLIRKNYICDLENSIGGDIYRFDIRERAEMWFDEVRIKWLRNRYLKLDVEYFESPVIVDNFSG